MSKILGKHIPSEVKNYAINGALDFWQEKAGTTTTVNTATTANGYTADMLLYASVGSTVKNYSIVRSTDVPSFAQSGFQSTYSKLFTMLTGISSFAATDTVEPFQYRMEGLDYAKIHGKATTFGFWFKASVAGTYNFAMTNASEARTYTTTFTAGAGVWEYKKITVVMDTTGTWNFDTNMGVNIRIGHYGGSNYTASSLDQWNSTTSKYSASTATNWMATTNATIRIAQFSIVEGSLGLSAQGFQRANKTIQGEFANCQRYYWRTLPGFSGIGAIANGASGCYYYVRSPVQMRQTPTLSGGTGTFALNIGGANLISTSVTPVAAAADADGGCIWSVVGFTALTANAAYQSTPAGSPTGWLTADARL